MGSIQGQASAADLPSPDPPPPAPVQVAAFYRFTAMAGLAELRGELLQLASALGVRGTILLAEEGVNGTISGPEAGVAAVLARLRQCPGLEPLEAKLSWAPQQTFHRLKVRIKREIVTMGCPTVKPAERVGTYVPPEQWEALIRDPDTLLVDTRNAYEVAIGTFEGAIDPGTASFREFPAWVERELRPLVQQRRPKTIAMFCTGGIRCEKSTAYLLQQGFEQVVHLQGGILRYLEEHPGQGSSWRGECYVFDQRVSVNHRLEPGSYSLCHACGLPVSPAERQHPAYREGVSCPHCLDRFDATDRARFAERQRQIERARARGEAHVGAVMPARPAGDGARPVLYSFRRCPYAIRARLALAAAGLRPGVDLALREVHLGARPPELQAVHPRATVPVLVLPSGGERPLPLDRIHAGAAPQAPADPGAAVGAGDLERQPAPPTVLSESLEIMLWALGQRDPQGWLQGRSAAEIRRIEVLIAQNDGPFKHHLDRWRYPGRFRDAPAPAPQPAGAGPSEPGPSERGPSAPVESSGDQFPQQDSRRLFSPIADTGATLSPAGHRRAALQILRQWSAAISAGGWLLGDRPSLADLALLPFVRQFRHTDPGGFAVEPDLAPLQAWLERFLASPELAQVMQEPWGPRRPWRSPGWLYHLALSEEWRQARAAGEYRRSSRGLSLEEVGFIHASAAHQIAATAARFYGDAPELTLLCIDPQRLQQAGVAVRWEAAPDPGGSEAGERFPHLYGPLPLQAVVHSEPWR